MARTVESIRFDAELLWDILKDIHTPRWHNHLPREKKIELINLFLQHTRERCHVIQVELDEWRAAMAKWEKENERA